MSVIPVSYKSTQSQRRWCVKGQHSTVNRMVAGSSPARGAIALFALGFVEKSGRFAQVRGRVRGKSVQVLGFRSIFDMLLAADRARSAVLV